MLRGFKIERLHLDCIILIIKVIETDGENMLGKRSTTCMKRVHQKQENNVHHA